MEAMALNKPVVATDVVGTNELVLNEKTGILVPFNDQDKFNEAILRLINDAALRLRLGKSGHQRIVEFFSESTIAGLWTEQYGKQLSN
jgi:Glycosyltransferase